jgi:hypothetical protein
MNSTDFAKSLQVGDYVLLALPVLCATLLRLPLASPKHGRRENAKPSRDNKGREKMRIRVLCRCPKYQQEMIFQHIGCSVFPFLAIFSNLARKKNGSRRRYKWIKLGPSRHIMRKQNLSSSYLENSFQQVSQIIGGIVKFSISPSSQIWLSPLGHDCQVQKFEN